MASIAFEVSSSEVRELLAQMGSPMQVQAGNWVFHRGDTVRGVFLVQSGQVELSPGGALDPSLARRLAGPGSLLGLPATMTGHAYSLSARALEDALLYFVERDRFLALVKESPQACLEVVDILAREVRDARRETAELGAAAVNG